MVSFDCFQRENSDTVTICLEDVPICLCCFFLFFLFCKRSNSSMLLSKTRIQFLKFVFILAPCVLSEGFSWYISIKSCVLLYWFWSTSVVPRQNVLSFIWLHCLMAVYNRMMLNFVEDWAWNHLQQKFCAPTIDMNDLGILARKWRWFFDWFAWMQFHPIFFAPYKKKMGQWSFSGIKVNPVCHNCPKVRQLLCHSFVSFWNKPIEKSK